MVYFLIFLFFFTPVDACRCHRCSQNIPEALQTPPLSHATEYTAFVPELGAVKDNGPLFEEKLKEHVKKYQNAAGMVVVFPDGLRKEVYRSAFLSEKPEALQELVQVRGVKTLINFHNTSKFDLMPWIEKEKTLFEKYGGEHYIYISDFNYQFTNNEEKEQILRKIALILNIIRYAPGNVLFHCMGGEHRSGIIYAILRKCYQHLPLETAIQEYQCHAAWISDENKGGVNPQNIELIRDFNDDCLAE